MGHTSNYKGHFAFSRKQNGHTESVICQAFFKKKSSTTKFFFVVLFASPYLSDIDQGNSSFLIIAVVLVCIFFAFPRSSNRGNGNSSNTSQVNFSNTFTEIDYKDDSWSFAVVAAKDLVKEKLKSPSTAKFPKSSEYIVKKRGNDYIVLGYVDAQNGFGTTIRTNWKATFTLGDTSGKQFEISNYEVTLYE